MKNNYKILLVLLYARAKTFPIHEEPGLSYIGAYMREHGYDVSFISFDSDDIDLQMIATMQPDIIGLTMYQLSREIVEEFCLRVKKHMPNIKICVGGVYPTQEGIKTLQQCDAIDYAVKGEGEETFLELVQRLQKCKTVVDVKGLIYREQEIVKENPARALIKNLDTLPWAARDVLEAQKLQIAQISSSRGCAGQCSFCTSQLFWKKWRGRSMSQVVDEIETIYHKYGIRIFNFIDNSFEDSDENGIARVSQFATEIIKRNLTIGYFAHIRAEFHHLATPDLMNSLVQSGLYLVCVGFESGNAEDLKLYNKKATVEDNEKAIQLFTTYDIAIDPGFINFNPYSTFDKLEKNLSFVKKHGLARRIYNLANGYQIYRGTALYHKVKKDKLLLEENQNEFSYRFVDERIGKLFTYVCGYVERVNKEKNYGLETIRHYVGVHMSYLCFAKKTIFSDKETAAIIDEHLIQIDGVLLELHNRTCQWFGELLYLAHNGWNIQTADKITKAYMHADYIENVVKQLANQKRNFIYNMVKNDSYNQSSLSFIM